MQAGVPLKIAEALLKWQQPLGDFNKLATIGKLNEQNDVGGEELLADVDSDGNVIEEGDEDLISEEQLR